MVTHAAHIDTKLDETPAPDEPAAGSDSSVKRRALRALERFTELRRKNHVERLQASRQAVFDKLREVPDRMQKVVNQMRLLLELVDDYSAGRYRGVRWYALGVAVLATLYFLSPSDIVPDWLPLVGQVDDVAAIAIAIRMLRTDLERYCRFRGLDPAAYF